MKPDAFYALFVARTKTRGKHVAQGCSRKKGREEGETTHAGSSEKLNRVKGRFVSRREGRCQPMKRRPRMETTPERVPTINSWCFRFDFEKNSLDMEFLDTVIGFLGTF